MSTLTSSLGSKCHLGLRGGPDCHGACFPGFGRGSRENVWRMLFDTLPGNLARHRRIQHPKPRLLSGVDRLAINFACVRAWKRADEEPDESEVGIDGGLWPTPQSEEELLGEWPNCMWRGQPNLLRRC